MVQFTSDSTQTGLVTSIEFKPVVPMVDNQSYNDILSTEKKLEGILCSSMEELVDAMTMRGVCRERGDRGDKRHQKIF